MEILLEGWEHECCGAEITRGQRVQWICIVHTDGQLYETHHELQGLRTTAVDGVVANVELVQTDGKKVAITHIPSGESLRSDDDRERVVTALKTGEELDASTLKFVATVQPDG